MNVQQIISALALQLAETTIERDQARNDLENLKAELIRLRKLESSQEDPR